MVAVIGGTSGTGGRRSRIASCRCREKRFDAGEKRFDSSAFRRERVAGGGVGRHREGGCRQGRAIDDL